jgi:RHS repeat-associated protein
MEVIRPGGNAVVFDFAWDATRSSYSALGTPLGWNGRDARRTYVLRDLDPTNPSSTQYALEFADGTVQTFNTTLTSISEPSGLSTAISSALSPTGDSADSDRYSITLNSSQGKITSIDYQTKPSGTGAQTIRTAVNYSTSNPNTITQLLKTTNALPMPEFEYSLSGSTITTAPGTTGVGETITRSASTSSANVANSDVTITVTPATDASEASGASSGEKYHFNADSLVTSDTAMLAGSADIVRVTYAYQTGSRSTVNGYAPWGKVTLVSPTGGSWTAYKYQADTGWVWDQITPLGSNAYDPANPSANVERQYFYGSDFPGDEDAGFPDPMALVQRPNYDVAYVAGTLVGETMNKYMGTTVVSRLAPSFDLIDNWTSGVFQSTTTTTAYNASTTTALGGSVQSTASAPDATTKQTTHVITQLWGGNVIDQSTQLDDAFFNTDSTDNQSMASVDVKDTSTTADAFGRSTADTLSGGAHSGATYDNSATWFGPVSVAESDGSTTKYTYSPMGQVASKIIYAGTNHAVKYSWVYDGAGHAVSVTMASVNSSDAVQSSPPPVTNTYQYDALGRLTLEVDNSTGTDVTANRTTTYDYPIPAPNLVVNVTNPDGSTETITHALDGTLLSDTGTAVTSTTGASGVIDIGGTSAFGQPDAYVQSNSTWTSITTDGTKNTTTTYTNMLGQVYLVQKTQPGTALHQQQAVTDALTSFDGDGRIIQYVDFDKTVTLYSYDPITGQLASTVTDMNRNGVYDPGIDQKSISTIVSRPAPTTSTPSPAVVPLSAIDTNPTDFIGSWSSDLASSGSNTSYHVVNLSTAGTDSITNVNGQAIETKTPPPANGGWVSTTINPDLTKTVDTFVDGLLAEEQNQTAGGSDITKPITYGYDGLRRLINKTDFSGTTAYSYFQDGTQQAVTEPGHTGGTTVSAIDPGTNAATQTQRPDTQSVNTPQNPLGQTSAQFGAGVLPATLAYDITGTGQLTSLTTYQGSATFSGTTISGSGAATTGWGFDPATGQLTSQTNADNSTYQYQFNSKFQLSNIIEPGITGSSFIYTTAGQLASSSLTDSVTGKVSSAVSAFDELGRPLAIADSDNGRSYTTLQTFDDHQRPLKTVFGSAGNVGLKYDYAPDTGYASTESPGAIRTLTVMAGDGTSALSTTGYAYSSNSDSTSKRLQTITLPGGGLTAKYNYFTGSTDASDQINSIQINPASGNGITITYLRDPSDKARIDQVGYTGSSGNVLTDATINDLGNGNFNQIDQITGRHVSRTKLVNTNGTITSQSEDDRYNYQYDPNHADALTAVLDANTNASLYGYSFDNVGNRTNLGTPNSVNEYAGFTYNARHDLTSDGTFNYGYDAEDRLISVTPISLASGSVKETMGYDSQNRMLWQDQSIYNGTAWIASPSTSRRYIWDGDNIAAELDGSGQLLQKYTYGPGGPNGLTIISDYTSSPGTPTTYVDLTDLSGNDLGLVNIDGTMAVSNHYGPFGENFNAVLAQGLSSNPDPFGFAGGLRDFVTGLVYLRNRWYDPAQGRFLTEDPNGIAGGENLFTYGQDDPVNEIDRSGLDAQKIVIDFNNPNRGFNSVQYSKDDLLDMPGGKQYRITDVHDDRLYYVQVRNPATIPAGLPYSTISITRSEAASPLYRDSVWVEGTMTVWYDDQPISGSSKYFDSVMFQQQADAQRYADAIQLGRDVGQFVDGALHLLPGASIYLDLPEAISGKQMSTGKDLGDGGQAMAVGSVVFAGTGVVLDAYRARKLATQEALMRGILREVSPFEVGIAKVEQHHIFPQGLEWWFKDAKNAIPGFNIDNYVVDIGDWYHDVLHYGGGPGKGGGWYNEVALKTLQDARNTLSRPLTHDELRGVGQQLRQQFKIDNLPVHPYVRK